MTAFRAREIFAEHVAGCVGPIANDEGRERKSAAMAAIGPSAIGPEPVGRLSLQLAKRGDGRRRASGHAGKETTGRDEAAMGENKSPTDMQKPHNCLTITRFLLISTCQPIGADTELGDLHEVVRPSPVREVEIGSFLLPVNPEAGWGKPQPVAGIPTAKRVKKQCPGTS